MSLTSLDAAYFIAENLTVSGLEPVEVLVVFQIQSVAGLFSPQLQAPLVPIALHAVLPGAVVHGGCDSPVNTTLTHEDFLPVGEDVTACWTPFLDADTLHHLAVCEWGVRVQGGVPFSSLGPLPVDCNAGAASSVASPVNVNAEYFSGSGAWAPTACGLSMMCGQQRPRSDVGSYELDLPRLSRVVVLRVYRG